MTRERIVERLKTLDGCLGCVSEDAAVELIEGLIAEAYADARELHAGIAGRQAPHDGTDCGCGECAGANSAADAIRTGGCPPASSPDPSAVCPGHGPHGTGPKCCDRAGEYNGYGSDGPTLFTCPNHCGCHD